jgi:hypothetical protein
MKKSISLLLFGFLICALGSATAFYVWRAQKMTKVHILEYPLLLSSDQESNTFHLLPKGTTLYFDQSYPEGFTRYKVYINIDRMPLKLVELDDPNLIKPIDAYSPSRADISKLLSAYPISKGDLAAILKSSTITKEEIRELLAEYSR